MKKLRNILFLVLFSLSFTLTFSVRVSFAYGEMPFYDLQPKNIVLRSEFYTSYTQSTPERKNNIKLASNSLNNTFIDVGMEFSFNKVVGARTESRGYKTAKIIASGRFIDGVGGGVCQVSSTLYNAVLLSGLKITEYHPHSLPVSYIAPSFDAMVNSGSADLKFVNNTHNPIIIKTTADDATIKISIYGEPMKEKYVRQSRIIEELEIPEPQILIDEKGEYPDLLKGQSMVLNYGKKGYISEGIIIKTIDGKIISSKKIRRDKYKPSPTVIIQGTAELSTIEEII